MPRISPINPETASPELQQTLYTVKSKMGGKLPNLVTTFAQSPAALNGYLGFGNGVQSGTLSPQLREQIALVVAQANGCDYCLAAHSMLGKMRGLDDQNVRQARQGQASDPKVQAALGFAQAIVEQRGRVTNMDLQAIRDAGYNDEEIVEITVNVAYNILTNYLNNVADTDIDFPHAPPLSSAAD
ncbi:carboxymuconolactone decarboxylase family protein [Deinococcus peraridilitoris]|uniref:Alkylhydroperoxidase AhpD family core domain protein n=1 Tax=Deinococcus peraridilitoris (strain DSM 19664 / LMG 22246 / CIP 109416 / KR-200) TaxID=937777 RepID=L0A639_DEIPD|nr:carboxymuconolactone decarboxylase family protein [Deinococcus peraridilitoris]AFZ69316.1 alkylhydroperoxidase AhpD family core domain protein [Deinococcus peraridilitoris DSM 19664]